MLTSLVNQDVINTLLEIAKDTPQGCFVEFGVYKGGSAEQLAKLAQDQARDIYLYDTFEGIPVKSDIDSHKIGDFSDTSYEEVKKSIPYAKIVKGIFPESYREIPKIAFAHIDADQYLSVKAACEVFGSNMAKGGIMVFDDVWSLEGATKALEETGWKVEKTRTHKAMVSF